MRFVMNSLKATGKLLFLPNTIAFAFIRRCFHIELLLHAHPSNILQTSVGHVFI